MGSVQFIRERERDYPGIVEKVQEKFLISAGVMVRGQAALLAPKASGNLRGSITWRTKDKDGAFNAGDGKNVTGTMISSPSKDEVFIGTNVEYAEYMEYGTRNTGAQPYLRPAIDENRRNLIRRLRELVQAEIEFGRT